MALSTVSVAAATAGSTVLLSTHQTTHAARQLHKLSQKTPGHSHAGAGADTISAGTTSLLIGLNGADTLGSATVGAHAGHHAGTQHGAGGHASILPTASLAGGLSLSYASTGNQTLSGAGLTLPPAPPGGNSPAADIGTYAATVFGAAIAGSVVVFNQGPAHTPAPAATSGAAPDLLVGWSTGQAGYTIDLSHGPASGTPKDGAVVSMGEMPRQGVIDILFTKPG